MQVFPKPVEFEWDAGNSGKNLRAHRVSDEECEEAFFDAGKRILNDTLHSGEEKRYLVLGATKAGRRLFIACTIRGHKIRVISARDLNKKEHPLLQ